jgi:hypothetical protein
MEQVEEQVGPLRDEAAIVGVVAVLLMHVPGMVLPESGW